MIDQDALEKDIIRLTHLLRDRSTIDTANTELMRMYAERGSEHGHRAAVGASQQMLGMILDFAADPAVAMAATRALGGFIFTARRLALKVHLDPPTI